MILTSTRLGLIFLILTSLLGCGSSSGSAADGTRVDISAAPTPANSVAQSSGAKSFSNDLGDSITITRAYLVLASATIETVCGLTFTAFADHLFSFVLSNAAAHTTTTPTSTGEPHVINLLAADDVSVGIGSLSPPVNDYCGIRIDMLVADADAAILPTGAGEPVMIGKSVYIEGNYTLAGGGSGVILINSSAALANRDLLLSMLLPVSIDNLNGRVDIGINYDTWFNAVDMALLETETSIFTNPADPNVSRVLQNIIESIHQR
jgi:hypothetical protein